MSQAPIWHVATDAMIADTTHLDTLEFGAYLKLMMAQWRNNGKPLENNPKRIALMMGVTQAQFKRIWPVISPFFEVTETTISQQRIAKDFKNVIEKIEKNKENGKRGGEAKSLKNKEVPLPNATETPERNPTIPEPEPEPDSKKSISKDIPKNEGKSDDRKCKLKTIFESDSTIPADYRKYAEDEGLHDIESTFENWRDWWFSEGGGKVGAKGWKLTWQGRVRKDVERQGNGSGYSKKQGGFAKPSITEAARLAIHRHRANERDV
jgi:uncharacterized protein YdaU (DUF1376 family)